MLIIVDIITSNYYQINYICPIIIFPSEAHYPGSVENFDVFNITARTANISWTGLSGVTYFLITLEDHGLIENVTGGNGHYQYMLNNFKPYKNYTVSIACWKCLWTR